MKFFLEFSKFRKAILLLNSMEQFHFTVVPYLVFQKLVFVFHWFIWLFLGK